MALPQFSKVGVTPLIFPRGPAFGDDYSKAPNQVIGYSETRAVRVATLGAPDVILPLVFPNVPIATWTAALAWLDHSLINWAANTFTYTDKDTVAWLVRCINVSLTRPRATVGLCDLSFTLRVET